MITTYEGLTDDRLTIAQSELFDAEYYRLTWPELGQEADPIEHYLLHGWESSNPGPGFDGLYYLAANEDVKAAGLNPLLHYLRNGKSEGRRALAPGARAQGDLIQVAQPLAPTQEEWAKLRAARATDYRAPVVDVIVPVYRNRDQTLRCIFSVLSMPQRTPFRLVAVDDCSPEPDLSQELAGLAREGLIELHRNAENLGFVGTCNLAMDLHGERDVVLLNSDTEVYGDWLDRLRAAAFSRPKIATVTPFSNNAEICSYPHFVEDNWWRLELPDAELDALAAKVNAGATVDIPTGVGFCMYIQRACLKTIGLFDEESFGKGYGEENDLCRRAAEAGWTNVLAPNIFVRHYGGSSFGDSKNARVLAAIRTVERLHPGYGQLVGDFVGADPIAKHRKALDVARLARLSQGGSRGAMLFITHSWGGGTERHVQEMCKLTVAAGVAAVVGRVDPSDHDAIALEPYGLSEFPNLPVLRASAGVGPAAEALDALGVSHLHVHHLAGFSERMSDFIGAVASASGLAYDVTLHDYVTVCPRITLIDRSDVYCGEPDLASCERCIADRGSPFGHPQVWEWRVRHARMLRQARKVFVPSRDVAIRMGRYVSDVEFVVRAHPEELSDPGPALIAPRRASRRIALLGAIGPHKGSALLAEVAKAAKAHDLPVEFVLVGYSDRNDELAKLGVEITGPYKEGQGARLLREVEADAVWFASVWPETYSYTLSDAFAAGRLPVAFDLGAVADRIREAEFGHLMPIDLLFDPVGVAVTLAQLPLAEGPRTPFVTARYDELFSDYYEFN